MTTPTNSGRCDFLDVLEEAVTIKKPVQVELRDGQRFVDGVKNVVTEAGEDHVVFQEHDRVPVTQLASCTPVAHEPASYDEKL